MLSRGLHEYIDDLQRRMNEVGDAAYSTFFAMKPLETMVVPDPRMSTPPPLAFQRSQ